MASDEIWDLIYQSSVDNLQDVTIISQLENILSSSCNLHSDSCYMTPLYYALSIRAPIKVIEIINKYDSRLAYNIGEVVHRVYDSPNRTIKYMNTVHHVLSELFGVYFYTLNDVNIDIINYVEKCLKIMNINESEIEWDILLKIGLYN